MSIIVTKIISWIFHTWLKYVQANQGYIDRVVVSTIQAMKISRTMLSRVHGIFFGSRDMSSETSVTSATIIANGMSYANDQVKRCGFMNPIQVHTSTPICGRQRMNGSVPKITSVRTISLMIVLAPAEARKVVSRSSSG